MALAPIDEIHAAQIQAGALGCVDKGHSQMRLVLIQGCSLGSSYGSRGFVGCEMGSDRAAAAI